MTASMAKSPNVVGSGSLVNHKYFKDIDALESIDLGEFNTRLLAQKVFCSNLKAVVRKVILQRDMFVSEIKLGYDFLFQELYQAKTKKRVMLEFDKMKKRLKSPDKKKLKKIIQSGNLYQFKETIRRDFYTLRWDTKELLFGKKVTYDGSIVSILDCVKQKTLVKLDCFIPYAIGYKELSVIYTATYHAPNRKVVYITAPVDREWFPVGSMGEIENYDKSDNTLKFIKRTYMLCKYIVENTDKKYDNVQFSACKILNKLDRIIVEDSSALDRILDEVETAIQLLSICKNLNKKTRYKVIKKLIFQILSYNGRIADTIVLNESSNESIRREKMIMKSKIGEFLMKIQISLFNEAVRILPNGDIKYLKDETTFIAKLEEICMELNDRVKPLVKQLIKYSMKKHELKKGEIREMIKLVREVL
jgi:hypothetical protein